MIDRISLVAVYPEIIVFVMACAIALIDLGVKSPKRSLTYGLTLLTMAVVAVLEALYASNGAHYAGFGNMVVVDAMGAWLKCFAAVAVMVTLVYGRTYAAQRDMLRGGELFTLSLFSLLGMFVMISGNNLLVLYMGLELLTLSSYALVALRRDNAAATEAAMKYFVLGAMASGFLLYGMSMLYAATGSLDLQIISSAISNRSIELKPSVFGLVFIVAGLAFKLGVVPFHMWIPDVYQGAPTVITLMVGGAPKFAAFALALRLLTDGLLPLAIQWQQMLMVLAIASLVLGNFAAIMQTNVKRMLAFSTVSQMGFVLLGLMSGVINRDPAPFSITAYSAAMFYVVSYVLTTLASFGIILLLAREGFESEEMADFAGLNQRSPLYAGIMALCLLSLAGIPPLMGFYAKFAVLQAMMASGSALYTNLAIFAVLMSLVGAFYYLRLIKVMYFDPPITASGVTATLDVRLLLCVNGALILLLGLWPDALMKLCLHAIQLS